MNRKRANRETLLAYLLDEPWALPLATLSMIVDRVMNWPDMEWAAAFGRQPAPASRQGTIGIIPLYGIIEARASVLDEFFGVTSITNARAAFRAAMADPNVRAIVFDIDSPGGSAAGVQEFADEIRAARGQGKHIVAHANTLAASAAYWTATSADEVIVSPSGSVGSVGVIAIHQEFSKALEDAGVTTTIISSGEFKGEGNPYEPLTDEAKGHLQERSDTIHAQFVAGVAKSRDTTAENVRSNYGKGRLILARQALKAGMVDRVESFDATLARLSRSLGGAQPSAVRAEDEPLEDDDPIPFHERALALARESDAVAQHAVTRIELRAKENDLRTKEGRQSRALLSTETTSALRSSRDALSALLATVEPEPSAELPQPVQPATVIRPEKLRPVSRDAFLASLPKEN